MRNSLVISVCILISCLSFTFCSSAYASDDDQMVHEMDLRYIVETPVVDVGLENLAILGLDDELYTTITVPGLDNRVVPGEPIVPFKTAKILVPYGEDVQEINISPGDESYLGKLLIAPGQFSFLVGSALNSSNLELEFIPPNEDIYNSTDIYPQEAYSIVGVQDKCGYKILYINLYPIRYIPKTRDVYYYESFDIDLTTMPLTKLDRGLFRGSFQDKDAVSKLVDNPEYVNTYKSDYVPTGKSPLLDGEYDYVIITNQNLKNASCPYNFTTLADWKTSRGVATAIVTVEDIYETYFYSGIDEQNLIRNFIRDAYLNNNITYVLLGGDADGAHIGGETWDNIVPVRTLWAYHYEPHYPADCDFYVISDLYYACLNGSFDHNGNGIYGEPDDGPGGGEVDLMSEVYVGRAPVDNEYELNNFVRKTIAYESTNIADPYLTYAGMVGQYLGRGGVADWGGNYLDLTKELFPSDRFYLKCLYDRDYKGENCNCSFEQNNWPLYELVNLINGNVHIINHVGTCLSPCSIAFIMKMTYGDADSLTNEKYFFGYSQSGYAASFDNMAFDSFYPFDCIAEHMVTAPGGAFAFIGNSKYGIANANGLDSPSQVYNYKFWDLVFNEGIMDIGKANQQSKEFYAGIVSRDDDMRYCYYGLHLLGDPETSLIMPPEKRFDVF